jgi:hypothetical protein
VSASPSHFSQEEEEYEWMIFVASNRRRTQFSLFTSSNKHYSHQQSDNQNDYDVDGEDR